MGTYIAEYTTKATASTAPKDLKRETERREKLKAEPVFVNSESAA